MSSSLSAQTDPGPLAALGLSHDIWRGRSHPLDPIFRPKNVAVIGATERAGSVGRSILHNLTQSSFHGRVYPVNPKHDTLMQRAVYARVGEIPDKVDLAVIITPASTVPHAMEECAAAGVKGAIVISAGFKERGPEGSQLERRVVDIARRGGIRLIGPNCLGVMNPSWGLNATFATKMALPGKVAFISQSGALCTAVLDWSLSERVGFSYFVSAGSMADVDWGDLIDYMGDDPETQSILIYMESIGNAKDFLSAAREVALTKPVIVLKAGRTEAAAKAAISHTGSIAGSDAALDAAFRRSGVLRVDEISDLFNLAQALAKQPRPKGPRLAIVTNAGGPGVLATDALIRAGGELAELSQETMARIDGVLPPHWSHGNPIDVLGDADAVRYARTLEILSKATEVDGLLVVLTPQAMTDSIRTAQHLAPLSSLGDRPILASWMGADDVKQGRDFLNRSGIPEFPYPDQASRVFQYMWQYTENLRALYETPAVPVLTRPVRQALPDPTSLVESARSSGRTILTEAESKQLLAAYGIPVVETVVARTLAEAVEAARSIGYPVVLKLHSETVTHKTDVGGVKLNLRDEQAVRTAWSEIERGVTEKASKGAFGGVSVQPMIPADGVELIIGSSLDAQLGPVIVFGAGGQFVEVFRDTAIGLPPLNTNLARRLMRQTKIFRVLKGFRGQSGADLDQLDSILVQFSQLLSEQPAVREIEINPLRVSGRGLWALDARVVLSRPGEPPGSFVIRPYPSEYIGTIKTRGGLEVTVRPIRPEDEPLMIDFHRLLSEQSVRRRYFRQVGLDERIAHNRLVRVCYNDYDREIALVASVRLPEEKILAVSRLSRVRGGRDAVFSQIVADPYHGQGLGTSMLERIVEIARREGVRRLGAVIPPDGAPMRRICEKLGFRTAADESGFVRAEMTCNAQEEL